MQAAEQISPWEDWTALQVLNEENQEELAQDQHNLLYCISNWLMTVSVFKRFEERHLVFADAPPQDRARHRASLTQVLATGEKILQELESRPEIDPTPIGIPRSGVASVVRELRLNYAEQFGGMTESRKKEILAEVFGVQE